MVNKSAVCLVVIWASVVATLVGFVMPWATVRVRQPGVVKSVTDVVDRQPVTREAGRSIGKVLGGVTQAASAVTDHIPGLPRSLPSQVRGIDIPRVANNQQSRLATAILELFTRTQQHTNLKSYAVYLVPGVALLLALVAAGCRRQRRVLLGVASVGALIAAAGFWKLLTTDTTTLFVAITIGPGLWLSLWAYVTLALGAAGLAAST